jgi:hypothetical protein
MFLLYNVLTGVIKYDAVLLHPIQDMNHPFTQNIHSVYTTHLLVSW